MASPTELFATLGKLPETAKDRGIVLAQWERMKNLIAKKMELFKKDWAVSNCYAAVSSILPSSSKLEALQPLAERVVGDEHSKPPSRGGRMPEGKDRSVQLGT